MGKWNEQFMLGINNLLKLKVPVQASFKDVQTFNQNLDKAEEVNNELVELKKKYEALMKEKAAKQQALKGYLAAIDSKTSEYDKARTQLETVMKKDKNADGLSALNAIMGGLRRIDGFQKTIALDW